MDLISRKEARERLKLTDTTFRRKLKELDIQCVTDILPNGVTSKKITHEDFMRLVGNCAVKINENEDNSTDEPEEIKELAILSMKMELVKAKMSLEHTEKCLRLKDDLIDELRTTKEKLEEKNEMLLKELLDMNKKFVEVTEKKKGFWSIFKGGL